MLDERMISPVTGSAKTTAGTLFLLVGLTACSHFSSNVNEQSNGVESEQYEQRQKAQQLAIQMSARKAQHEIEMVNVTGSRLMADRVQSPFPHASAEQYQYYPQNNVFRTSEQPVSTFSIDVDTGSYTNTRRMLNAGLLPPAEAVREEEFINYFDYQFETSGKGNSAGPFSTNYQLSPHPFKPGKVLLKVGLHGNTTDSGRPKAAKNLVFLLDVSGSMQSPNKLPLIKKAMKLLVSQLDGNDHVAIVVYAGASGVVLKPTSGDNRFEIETALDNLSAGGGTNGAQGIQLAYQLAEQHLHKDKINRVILATDGDFNVGMVDHKALIALISEKRDTGIALTTLGVGQGNYNDHLIEQLADAGNGHYAYIDTFNEARKVLVDDLDANLQIIAKDVKIQIEFNPQVVAEYRLVGYRNRQLNNEDFGNDKVDAGDIGAGHKVTAFYEIALVGSDNRYLESLRYANNSADKDGNREELAQIRLRYKLPEARQSQRMSTLVNASVLKPFDQQPNDFKFAFSVSSFAEVLARSAYQDASQLDAILQLAQQSKGEDVHGYRSEFVSLVKTAISLQ